MSIFTPDTFDFNLKLETFPPMISIQNMRENIFKYFFVRDSIFDFYPMCSFVFNDDAGLFTEEHFFSESTEWKMRFQSDLPTKFIAHNFYWSSQELPEPFSPDTIAGPVTNTLISHFRFQDSVKNRSYRTTLSNAIRLTALKYKYPLGVPNIRISETANTGVWYQGNMSDAEFISKHRQYAFSPTFPNSGFYTFFNLNGKFHFVASDELSAIFNIPKARLRYNTSNIPGTEDITDAGANLVTSDEGIQSFSYNFPGASMNLKNYQKTFWSYDGTAGTYIPLPSTIITKTTPGAGKLAIRKSQVALAGQKDLKLFGVIDDPTQQLLYKGWQNNQYRDTTSFPYRMRVNMYFNPDLVAGEVVNLTFASTDPKRGYRSREFNGNWVVLESIHGFGPDAVPQTYLHLGKSKMNIMPTNKFYADYI